MCRNLFSYFVGVTASDRPVIDVIDQCCPLVVERCLSLLPPAEKAAVLATSNVDLQWIADRSSCVWTAGKWKISLISLAIIAVHVLTFPSTVYRLRDIMLPNTVNPRGNDPLITTARLLITTL